MAQNKCAMIVQFKYEIIVILLAFRLKFVC